jgi:phosphate acetyltransferase
MLERIEAKDTDSERIAHIPLQAQRAGYQHLLALAAGLEPVVTVVVHPCDKESLTGAIEAANAGLIIPIFVAPESKLRTLATSLGIDLSSYELVPAAHSHEAAAKAVALVREGAAEALMKGSLHTDELMAEVVARETGLRTGRRMSHVFILDVPNYPRPLFLTDAAINISPTLMDKRDIVQNAIDLTHILGISNPMVAILSAVETINPEIRSTLDAAALCKMAERGQIIGGILDGPLAFDNAISPEAAKVKNLQSPVAGHADILVVPDLEAGNMLAKQLQYLAGARAAGIALGARVPIVLTSRADNAFERRTSCVVAQLIAHHRRSAIQ